MKQIIMAAALLVATGAFANAPATTPAAKATTAPAVATKATAAATTATDAAAKAAEACKGKTGAELETCTKANAPKASH
jgi:hypothetical protein